MVISKIRPTLSESWDSIRKLGWNSDDTVSDNSYPLIHMSQNDAIEMITGNGQICKFKLGSQATQ